MVDIPATQLWPDSKLLFGPFSYTKAIIKDDVTYPIVPNCPIINADEYNNFDYQNIPVGTFFIVHYQHRSWRDEDLCLRVPNDMTGSDDEHSVGHIVITSRWKNPTSSGGGGSTK